VQIGPKDGDVDAEASTAKGRRVGKKTGIRAVARLLARADNFSPVLFVDQPLFGVDGALTKEREKLTAELLRSARQLGEKLGVPVALWENCTQPIRRLSGYPPGSVALVEIDGLAPFVYSNFRGRLRRGIDPNGEACLRAMGQGEDLDMERAVVHAVAVL